jgi:KDO2-lipid IV(A) lauroyltransferase
MKQQLALASLRIFSLLPLGMARLFGRLLGAVMVRLSAQPYRVAKINIAQCFPELDDREVAQLAARRMCHFGQALFETPGLWRRSPPWLQSKILGVEGQHFLRQALDSGKGTIVLAPHQGNWEVLGLWLAKQAPMTSLFQPPKLPLVGDWIKRARQRTGAHLVPTNVRGVAALLKSLQRGQLTAILPDQQPPESGGEFAPLFGTPALTMTLPYNLLKRSSSQVLFACALRERGGWRLHFYQPSQTIYSADISASLSAMNSGIEAIANLATDQYQWEYKRFRARPKGSPEIYPKRL